MKFERSSGIILHPTSLPGKFGIGTIGKEACIFINFLKETKQKLWQILPLGPTGMGNCPYQNSSVFAANPMLIDLELLVEDGYLEAEDLKTDIIFSNHEVDFEKAKAFKYPLLRKAYRYFRSSADVKMKAQFQQFTDKQNFWLIDYSIYMALKEHFNQKPWFEWEKPLQNRLPLAIKKYTGLLAEEIMFHRFVQFIFFKQWNLLKKYAVKSGVKIIGDIPVFVAYDSSDVWVHPRLFQLNINKTPVYVSGVPPDYFSRTGQLWGNPLYNWDVEKKSLYKWWVKRLNHLFELTDIIRIDQLNGLIRY